MTFPKWKEGLLVWPFLLMFLWFRFETFLHVHILVLLVWVFLSFITAYLFWRALRGKSRIVICGLWIIISCLFSVDFLQLAFVSNYSESSFSRKVDETVSQVQKRVQKEVKELQANSLELETIIKTIEPFEAENVFIELRDRLPQNIEGWAVYNEKVELIAWGNGQFSGRETLPLTGNSELSVITQARQQFFKLKRLVSVNGNPLVIVVIKPFAADYGLENRYLSRYNRITDDLSLRPDLLHNALQSSSKSSNVIIRNLNVSPEFSMSLVFQKQQYGEYLISRIFQLHWWLELSVFVLFLFTGVYFFFEFMGISGCDPQGKRATIAWLSLVGILMLGILTISQFSAFGSEGFLTGKMEAGLAGLVHSPGGLLVTAFALLNVTISLVLLVRCLKLALNWQKQHIGMAITLIAFVICGVVLAEYYKFAATTLLNIPPEPLLEGDLVRSSRILGMLWMDLGVVVAIAVLASVVIKNAPRKWITFLAVLGLQLVSLAALYLIYRRAEDVPWRLLVILLPALAVLAYFLPLVGKKFGRMNLLSRFLIALLLFSSVSFLFHFSRFHYTGDKQRAFIEREVVPQVRSQETVLQRLMENSEKRLDEAIQTLSIDPKISDLAYRLWTRTEFARTGYKSAVEIYDEQGQLLNRFSIDLPRLAIPLDALLEQGWYLEKRQVPFGNSRKPAYISARRLPEGGFIVLETVLDFENLTFVPTSSPFQELFRPAIEPRLYGGIPILNVYDNAWRPIFLSSPTVSISSANAKRLLADADSAWSRESHQNRRFHVYYFRIKDGVAAFLVAETTWRNHFVHIIDLMVLNLFWLSGFVLVLLVFFRPYLFLHVQTTSTARFNFFQKMLFAFIVFAMVPVLSLSWLIRNYVWEKKFEEVSERALHSFSVATKVVGDYLFYRVEEQNPKLFSNELLEWISQVIQQDVSFYYSRYLLAASNREVYSAALLSEQISGGTYADLFLKGQKYSINELRIGKLQMLNVSGRVHTGRYRDEVISIPFLIDERSVQEEISGLREYMMMVGAGLVLFAVFLGYFLANRFSKPVEVLIYGTSEMSRGNLKYRIREYYQDEFQQLVSSFNAMAASLDEQQDALERRRAYIENILNNITTGVISIDSNTTVTTVNPAAANMFSLNQAYQGKIEDLLSSSAKYSEVASELRKFLRTRDRFQMKEIAVFQTGMEEHLRLVYVPLFSEDRTWNGAVLLIEDITDIIRSNRLSAWAEMARRVAHEVKNPLTPIQLAMEHLVRVYEDRGENFNEVLKSCSDAVLRQVKNLRKLVSEFSQYGRPAMLTKSPVQIGLFLQDLVATYQEHLPEGVSIESRVDPETPPVSMDVEKIRGALVNIIENGLQAMNGNGRMVIEAQPAEDHFVTIRVRDNGQGIPAELLPRLFEPYFSTKLGGTGLGLAIARKTIEDHGGKIHVESEPGKGTAVNIQLPAVAVERAENLQKPEPAKT